jgi:hypothetical protein
MHLSTATTLALVFASMATAFNHISINGENLGSMKDIFANSRQFKNNLKGGIGNIVNGEFEKEGINTDIFAPGGIRNAIQSTN